jgi:hypothetical protein
VVRPPGRLNARRATTRPPCSRYRGVGTRNVAGDDSRDGLDCRTGSAGVLQVLLVASPERAVRVAPVGSSESEGARV